ncbi:hypothetical protein DY000_02041932 [Brassica cretica]|uniref:Uncharacterized protein n=1 Tax=Brassica cretica TaxID=69181 RepID=A0ABQ7BCG7_BRACR|nr:hypothetical protein DY000_02041932 [Brassica cretica]
MLAKVQISKLVSSSLPRRIGFSVVKVEVACVFLEEAMRKGMVPRESTLQNVGGDEWYGRSKTQD